MATTRTIDTDNLEHIPEEHRANAKKYTSKVAYWTEADAAHGEMPEDKKVGDVSIPAHTRYTVTFEVS